MGAAEKTKHTRIEQRKRRRGGGCGRSKWLTRPREGERRRTARREADELKRKGRKVNPLCLPCRRYQLLALTGKND